MVRRSFVAAVLGLFTIRCAKGTTEWRVPHVGDELRFSDLTPPGLKVESIHFLISDDRKTVKATFEFEVIHQDLFESCAAKSLCEQLTRIN